MEAVLLLLRQDGSAMPLIWHDQYVEIGGYSVPLGARAIHFYYTKPEQQRLLGFLLEGLARYDGVVIACAGSAAEALSDGLEMLGVCRDEPEITRIEITSNVRAGIAFIAAAAKDALRRKHRFCCRVLCDFGSMIGQEAVCEVESVLHSFLSELNLVSVTQYDGRGFGSPITIEQFQTHALAIVGSAFFCGNRYCAPPLPFVHKPAMRKRK